MTVRRTDGRVRGLLATAVLAVLALACCGGGGPSPEQAAAQAESINLALEQIAAGAGDQFTRVSVQLRAPDPIVSALVIDPEQAVLATVDRDGYRAEPRGSVVGLGRSLADWQAIDFVGFAAGSKCAEPIVVSAFAARTGFLILAECGDTALKVELDGAPLPELTDYTAERTWRTFVAEAAAVVDLNRVTQVSLWGTGALDGQPWFVINGMAVGSAGAECEMHWSRRPDPLNNTHTSVPAVGLTGCIGAQADPVTFDLGAVPAAELAAAVTAAESAVGRPAAEVGSFTIGSEGGQLVLTGNWGAGAKVSVVIGG